MEDQIEVKQELEIKMEIVDEENSFETYPVKLEQEEVLEDFGDNHNLSGIKVENTLSSENEVPFEHLSESNEETQDNSDKEWSLPIKKTKTRKKRIVKRQKSEQLITSKSIKEEKTEDDLIADKKLVCPYCGYTASFPGNLQRHMREIHLKKNVFMCSLCDHQTTRKNHLKQHINTKHTKEIKYKCTFCEYEALSPNILRNHLNHIHTLHRWYACNSCEFKTTHSGNLKAHVQAKHEFTKLKFTCKKCDFTAEKKFHLSKHVDEEHERQNLTCSFCLLFCKSRAQVGRHIMKEHPEQAKFKCEFCKHKGLTEQNIRIHVYMKHNDRNKMSQNNYKCTDCDASYENFANLKKHINVKHV